MANFREETPAELLAGGRWPGVGIPGAAPLVLEPEDETFAFEPRVPELPELPAHIAPPSTAREGMAPVLPRGQQRGTSWPVTLAGVALVSPPGPLIDLADVEDHAEHVAVALSMLRVSNVGTEVLGDVYAAIDFGVSGGMHHVDVDWIHGQIIRLPCSTCRVTIYAQGVGQYLFRASVAAFAGGNRPAQRTVAHQHVAAGAVESEVPAFAARAFFQNNTNAAFTVDLLSRQGVVIATIPVPAPAPEVGPIHIPQGAERMRTTVVLAQNIRAIYELAL